MRQRILGSHTPPCHTCFTLLHCSADQGAIGGGGALELPGVGTGPRPWVKGSIYKKKGHQDPSPNTHTAATIRKEILTPTPKKKGT